MPTLGLATQQTNQLQFVNLAANNVSGTLGCANVGPMLQELNVSDNACVTWKSNNAVASPISGSHFPRKVDPAVC